MRASYEKITPPADASLHCFHRVATAYPFDWHYHREVELTLIERGRGRRIVGDHLAEYGPGDLCLIGSNLPHTWATESEGESEATSSAVVVQFDRATMGGGVLSSPELAGVRAMLDAAGRGLCFNAGASAAWVGALARMPEEPAARRLARLIDVLVGLSEAVSGAEVLASAGFAPALNEESRGRIERVCRYIHEHLGEPLEQTSLASMAGMNPAAFSRFFRRSTGRTPTDYVNELRVARACRLLVETKLSVIEVCLRSGFNNVANFNRRFRAIKAVTPTEYRKAMTDRGR